MPILSASGIISGRNPRIMRPAGFIVLLFAATLCLFWTGVGVNDAEKYIRYAFRLLDGEPWLYENHWALRLLLVAPIAASFAAFGVSEFASTIPNILYAAALVAVTFLFARLHLGSTTATAIAALVASSSFLVVAQSEVAIIGPEILAGVIACWLFHEATTNETDIRSLAAAGFFAGLAFYCRESAIYLLLTFGLCLLVRKPLRLTAIAALLAGFALVAGVELLVYAALTGDPFYRLAIDFGHRGGEGFYGLPDEGPQNPLIARLTLPLYYLLTAPAVTPFVVIAATLFAVPRFRRRLFDAKHRRVVGLFIIAAAANFLVSAYGANLKGPDYYPMLGYAALLVIGVFIGGLFEAGAARTRAERTGAALLAGAILLNWATADFRRYDEFAEARRLADHITQIGEAVVTDPTTAARTRLMLRLRGADRPTADRLARSLKEAPQPPCGPIYSATPTQAGRAIEPYPSWTLVWSQEVRKPRWTIAAVRALAPGVALSRQGQSVLKIAGPVALYDAGACAGQ